MNELNDTPKLMVENISCILPENKELGGLFLGNVYGAQNAQILKQYGIRAIITASIETKLNHSFVDIPFQLKIEAHDKDDYYITDHVNQCIHFIEQNRKNTNVFVHCFAGVSRSTAIVAAYLMWKYRWALQKTMRFLTFKRIAAKPNDGFYRQLKDIQAKLNIIAQNKPIIMVHPFNGQLPQSEKTDTKTPIIQLNSDQFAKSTQRFHQLQNFSGIGASPSKLINLQSDQIIQQNQTNQFLFNTQPAIRQFSLNGTHSSVFQKGNNNPSFSLKNKSKRSQIVSQRQYQNHSQIPIPKVLQKRNSINNSASKNNGPQEVNQQINTYISKYMSPNVTPASPPRPIRQKISIGKNPTTSSRHNSTYSNTDNLQIQNNQIMNITGKQIMDWKLKSTTNSRCFIRPKDLPGYKNY